MEPLHQVRNNGRCQIRTALQDPLAVLLQLSLAPHRQREQVQLAVGHLGVELQEAQGLGAQAVLEPRLGLHLQHRQHPPPRRRALEEAVKPVVGGQKGRGCHGSGLPPCGHKPRSPGARLTRLQHNSQIAGTTEVDQGQPSLK